MENKGDRLACYDAAAGRVEAARRSGEVVAVDRERVRREAVARLGLADAPAGRSEAEQAAVRAAAPRSLAERIATVRPLGGRGLWGVTLSNGQQWATTEATLEPSPGEAVLITTTMTGGFRASLGRRTPVAVRRLR